MIMLKNRRMEPSDFDGSPHLHLRALILWPCQTFLSDERIGQLKFHACDAGELRSLGLIILFRMDSIYQAIPRTDLSAGASSNEVSKR